MKKLLPGLFNGFATFFVFFVLVAFVVTCCFVLFMSIMSEHMQLVLTKEYVELAAKVTFVNVLFLSLAFSVIDLVRRHYTVEIPVRRILEVTNAMIAGDFSARITEIPKHDFYGFDAISRNLNRMAGELSGTETLRTDFIANVSHELKTPLAVMQNYGTMLQQPNLEEEKRIAYAKTISDAARRLAGLITNILKLNKLENQQIFPVSQRFDLSEQLCQSVLQFEEIWEQKNIELETDINDNIFIDSDAELLELVWNNLLSNAFKFTDKGGTVSVSLSAGEHFAAVKIADTGCGISSETGRHIFEKFYQGDTSHAAQGNGLGLALVKRVVDIMQGELAVESEVGKGSTFTVRLKRGEYFGTEKAD